MSWVKLDDAFFSNRKVRAVRGLARREFHHQRKGSMAKQRTVIDILRSITRAIDSLTPDERVLVLTYLMGAYRVQPPEAQAK